MNTLLKRCALTLSLLSVIIFSATFATPSSAAGTYTIKGIAAVEPGHNPILIGVNCTYDVAQIKVEVISAKAVSVADAHVSAYLYDADKKLLKTYDRPPTSPCDFPRGVAPRSLPIMYEAGEPRVFHFPAEKSTELPWESIVVIFGDDDTVVAKVYPSGNPRDFEFPEKTLLK